MRIKWKRPLAFLLSVVMIFSMNGLSAQASEAESSAWQTIAADPETECDESSGGSESTPCTSDSTEESISESEVQTGESEDAAETQQPEETPDTAALEGQNVLSWEWIGADNLNEGVLPLTGAGAENPVDFAAVVDLLPTGITATVEGSADPVELAVTWSCGDFPAQATEGEYTFTAALPEGYTLAADAAGLAVSVILGGGTTLETDSQPDGEGTEGKPYQISTADELFWFAGLVNGTLTDGTEQNAAACATLTADIDLSGETWLPIGNYSNNYTGTFDGGDHTIDGLKIDNSSAENQGFVSYLGSGGIIRNLTLGEDCSVTGGKNAGGICGYNLSGSIQACTNNGTVTGIGGYVGGICGIATGAITRCANSGAIRGDGDYAGGICGYSYRTVQDCANSGTICGDDYVGGICGYTTDAIQDCANSGAVSGNGNYVGGVCSYNPAASIQGCTNSGEVTGGSNAGGICGYSYGTIQDCANSGAVSGGNYVGGICGYNTTLSSVIDGCWSVGEVTGDSNVGGVCGYTSLSTITNCYWLDTAYSGNGIGSGNGSTVSKTADEFASGEMCWLLNGYSSDSPRWYQNLDNDQEKDAWPVLDSSHGTVYMSYDGCKADGYSNTQRQPSAHQYTDGFCSACGGFQPADMNDKGVYEISNAGQLFWFEAVVNGTLIDGTAQNTAASAVLTADITIPAGKNWTPIGNRSASSSLEYTGTFDGGGHTIDGLVINGTTWQGFVGYLGSGGIIRNLILGEDCSVTGEQYVGGICAGNLNGTITNCRYCGTVSARYYYAGGICGYESQGTVTDCYNIGKISGNNGVAGIVGGAYRSSTVVNCFDVGTVTLTGTAGNVGAICGLLEYSTVTNCYWLDTAYSGDGIGISKDGTVTDVEAKSADQFASGEVTYLLNGSVSEDVTWYQNLDNNQERDGYPTLDSTHGVVYVTLLNCAGQNTGYGNTQVELTAPEHKYDDDGFCTVCGRGYKPAKADENGVYQISSASDLFWFAALINGETYQMGITEADPDASAVLVNDIDLGGREWIPIAASTTFKNNATTVSDTTDKNYSGTFDGQGHTISNFTIRSNSAELTSGLFGAVTGTIQNVGIVNASFDNSGSYDGRFGALCGLLVKDGSTATAATIRNCYVVKSSIQASGKITGALAGANYGGTIESCYECGNTITGHSRIGHLVGDNQNDAESGTMVGTVMNCCSDKSVAGSQGGTVTGGGVCTAERFASGEACWLLNGSTSENVIWYQNLDNDKTPDDYPTLDSSHSVVYSTAMNCAGQAVGYSNTEPEDDVTIPDHVYHNGICTGCGVYMPAEQSDEGIYQITNAGQLFWFAALVNGDTAHAQFDSQNTAASAVLTADIDLSGRDWTPMGSKDTPYTGTFDGAGYTIDGLKIDSTADYQGFAGCMDREGVIQNLILGENCSVKGGNYVGGLCGFNANGTIRNCANYGTVTGSKDCVGGLCGDNSGIITGCYSTGNVTGMDYVGGLCGYNRKNIVSCYWLDGTASAGIGSGSGTNVEAKTAGEFASGEVTYLLNGSTSRNVTWYQTLSEDDYPLLDAAHSVVYPTELNCAGQALGYSNTQVDLIAPEHQYGDDGFCTACGGYEPAAEHDGVYEISNVGQFFWFAGLVNGTLEGVEQNLSACAMLTDDIDLANATWIPIAASTTFKNNATTVSDTTDRSYSGIFDGQGHTISNFTIRSNSAELTSGLFGAVTGTIQNVGIVNASFDNSGSYDGRFGALCGLLVKDGSTATAATIRNCYVVKSSIQASGKIAGALAGANYGGTIENCYECGNTITGHSRIGHLVGDNQNDAKTDTMIGSVINCYSDKLVAGSQGGNVTGGVCTAGEFASGEVTYLLNGSTSENVTWYQNVDNDKSPDGYPTLNNCHAVVYRAYINCQEYGFSNQSDRLSPIHSYDGGFCTLCNAYQPAETNESGAYEITNVGQLLWFAALVNGDTTQEGITAAVPNADAVLTTDIDLTGEDWTPIGTGSVPFTGTFDGQGHIISGMTIENALSYSGLFGNVTGTIRNFTVTGSITINTDATDCKVGGAVGSLGTTLAGGTVSGVTSDVDITVITGRGHIGGVVGSMFGDMEPTVENCAYAGTITDSADADCLAGVVGYIRSGTIRNCTNQSSVSVSGSGNVGGILGYCNNEEIYIFACYNTGSVTGGGTGTVGAIIGQNKSNQATVTNCCYLNSSADRGQGQLDTDVEGTIKVTDKDFPSGAVCWLLNGSTGENVSWYQTLGDGGDARPVLDATHGTVYYGKDCGGTEIYSNSPVSDEHVFDDDGCCTLCGAYQPAERNGEDVYEISNAGQLFWFAALVNGALEDDTLKNNSANGVLTADITIPDRMYWTPIGAFARNGSNTMKYFGIFDGQGYTIDGLVNNNEDAEYQGFVGSLAEDGIIRNLTLGANCCISGHYSTAGICADNEGAIINCTNNGEVIGKGAYVGGICGGNNMGVVADCINSGMVSSTSNSVGGICGYVVLKEEVGGTITDCANYGDVSGSGDDIGSVSGNSLNGATITNCYWLEGTASNGIGIDTGTSSNVEAKTADEFKSGEVCWLLNNESADGVWKQTLGQDNYPNFTGLTVALVDGKYTNVKGDVPYYILAGYSLSLAGDIGVNFYMDLGENPDLENLTMKFDLPNGTVEEVPATEATNLEGTTYYGFTCHVAAKEMTADITAQLYSKEDTASKAYTYTVRDYADYILEHPETYAAEQELVKNMLNYGGYAQVYFEYNAEKLASNGITISPDINSVTEESLASYAPALNGSVDGITYYGTSLILETTTKIRFYFTLAADRSIGNYTFTYGESELAPVQKGNMYYVEMTGIPAANLGTEYELVVSDNNQSQTQTITYSAYGYGYQVLKNSTEEALQNLVRALYLYGKAAESYNPAAE